jgi:predicted acyltransferase
MSDRRKVVRLLVGAAVALAIGYAWSVQFPIVKKLWTSSFVLVAAGWSGLLLAAFHYVVEVRGWRRWCTPFVWIGMNPITLYLLSSLVGFHGIAERLVGGSVAGWLNGHIAAGMGEMVLAVATLALILGLARFLYVRRIFLKV